MVKRAVHFIVASAIAASATQVHAGGSDETCNDRLCQRKVHVTANGSGCMATVDFRVLTFPADNRRALIRLDLETEPGDSRTYRFSRRAMNFKVPIDSSRDLVWAGTSPGGDDLGVSDDGQTYMCLNVNTNSKKRLDFDIDVLIDGTTTHCVSQDPTINNQG